MAASYRPRNSGHDYYGRGTYLITLVVSGRERLLSHLANENSCGDQDKSQQLQLTPLGEAVQQTWQNTPDRQYNHGNHVKVHACVCMPDHFHGVIEVIDTLQWSLGDIIQAFKAACTSFWQQFQGLTTSVTRPISAECISDEAPEWLRAKAAQHPDEGSLVRSLSKKQREFYFSLVGRQQRSLFDDNYDDTVCLDDRHLKAMVAYVIDNPRRAMLKHLLPDVLRRCLCVQIGERRYASFGNLFLLRWPRKMQVQCHRRHPVSHQPYEETSDYSNQRRSWEASIMEGSTVLITPGISRGELLMKNECLKKGYPLIHLQKEPIGKYWKPEKQRFEACAKGALLILVPWDLDAMDGVGDAPASSDYSRFHNLNAIAAELCTFEGEARIIRT